MSRKQTEFKFFIGYTTANLEADQAIIQAASALCGGCFVAEGTGYWIDGETIAERFEGKANAEHCLVICLTTENHKADDVYNVMQAQITEIVKQYSLPVQWVHVQEHEITGRHFEVK